MQLAVNKPNAGTVKSLNTCKTPFNRAAKPAKSSPGDKIFSRNDISSNWFWENPGASVGASCSENINIIPDSISKNDPHNRKQSLKKLANMLIFAFAINSLAIGIKAPVSSPAISRFTIISETVFTTKKLSALEERPNNFTIMKCLKKPVNLPSRVPTTTTPIDL